MDTMIARDLTVRIEHPRYWYAPARNVYETMSINDLRASYRRLRRALDNPRLTLRDRTHILNWMHEIKYVGLIATGRRAPIDVPSDRRFLTGEVRAGWKSVA